MLYYIPYVYKILLLISISKHLQDKEIEHRISLAIWCPVRCQTIDLLKQQSDQVLKILRDARIAKIAGASASLVVGGSLSIIGLILIPFTFGASVGLTVSGAAVGIAGTTTSLGASIASKKMTSSKLNQAREHIKLDQQLSEHVNKIQSEYKQALENAGASLQAGHVNLRQSESNQALENGGIKSTSLQVVASGSRAVFVGITKGITAGVETTLDAGVAVVRIGSTGIRVLSLAGGVVGTALIVVTVPLDSYQIYKNSRELIKSFSGEKGKNEEDEVYKWYMKQISELEEEFHKIEKQL